MSDVIFYGVLRMPQHLAMADPLSRGQFYARAQEAANRVEAADKRIAELEEELRKANRKFDVLLDCAHTAISPDDAAPVAAAAPAAVPEQTDTLRKIVQHCDAFHRNSAIALSDVRRMAQAAIDAAPAPVAEIDLDARKCSNCGGAWRICAPNACNCGNYTDAK